MNRTADTGSSPQRCTLAVRIRRPAVVLYSAWQDLARRPSELVARCRASSERPVQEDVIKAPCVGDVSTALLVDQIPGVFLAWRSLPQASVHETGEVWFHPNSDSSSTEVRMTLTWESEADTATQSRFVDHARAQIEKNLDCFKRLMEN